MVSLILACPFPVFDVTFTNVFIFDGKITESDLKSVRGGAWGYFQAEIMETI